MPDADNLGEEITRQEIQTASRVETQARSLDDDTLWEQVHALSTEYESLRKAMPSGPTRTNAMTRVFVKMRTLGPSVVSFVDDLKRSRSAGERLFAIAIMQIEPDVADIDWLEKRFQSERPFVFFHAANALRVVAHAAIPSGPPSPVPSQREPCRRSGASEPVPIETRRASWSPSSPREPVVRETRPRDSDPLGPRWTSAPVVRHRDVTEFAFVSH